MRASETNMNDIAPETNLIAFRPFGRAHTRRRWGTRIPHTTPPPNHRRPPPRCVNHFRVRCEICVCVFKLPRTALPYCHKGTFFRSWQCRHTVVPPPPLFQAAGPPGGGLLAPPPRFLAVIPSRMGSRTPLSGVLQFANTTAAARSGGSTLSAACAPFTQTSSTVVFRAANNLKLTSTLQGHAGSSTMVPFSPSSPFCSSIAWIAVFITLKWSAEGS
jgi:hypothetical protein